MLIWKSSTYGKIHWMHQPIQVTVVFVFVFSVLISNFRSNYDCRRMENNERKGYEGRIQYMEETKRKAEYLKGVKETDNFEFNSVSYESSATYSTLKTNKLRSASKRWPW